MADAEEPEAESAPAPEEAPPPAPEPVVDQGPFPRNISAAQLLEVWAAPTDDDAITLLARCLLLPEDYSEDLRTVIWLDMLFKWLDFGKRSEVSPSKALAFMGLMAGLHIHAIETLCSKVDALQFFTESLLTLTKSLPIPERFTLAEVQAFTHYATANYLEVIKLHQLVFTEEQTVRPSHIQLFVETPAKPPATADAIDPDAVPPPAPESAVAEAPAPAEPPAADAAEPPAPEPEPEPQPALGDEALAAAISATISSQVAALQQGMAAEYAAQEQYLLDRIAALEAKVG